MTPEEIKNKSIRSTTDHDKQVEAISKDMMEIDRLEATKSLEKYQEETRKWRDKKVVSRAYSLGDLVLIRTQRTEAKGELEPKWEGPYIISKVRNPGSYRLKSMDGEELQHSWNADNLRMFYV